MDRYSITSSARASSVGGTVRPSALAALTLKEELELGRLLHRQVRGLRTLENFVHVLRRPPVHVAVTRSERHQAAGLDRLAVCVHARQAAFRDEVDDPAPVVQEHAIGEDQDGFRAFLRDGCEGAFEIFGLLDVQELQLDTQRPSRLARPPHARFVKGVRGIQKHRDMREIAPLHVPPCACAMLEG
jgi:hypothetical protein